ncbi:hypothetical protein [Quatrionicoccus australiensis]|uniref:hypothetical protein n=1 Tax=Quatrionicoccus australiensis TaxID=138118 RepID=UPI001CF958B9|nr:hypothetical protein [Quatrionicoccus australiensis]MCB4359582.1 hypothetical protein [Quatrionicoccus australiensis]
MTRKTSSTRRARRITSVEWPEEYDDEYAMLEIMAGDPKNPLPLAECIRQMARLGILAREHIYAKNVEDDRRKIDRQERFTLLKYICQNNILLREQSQLSDDDLDAIAHDSEVFATQFLRQGDALELASVQLKNERLRALGLPAPSAAEVK